MPQLSLDDNLRRDYEAGFQQSQAAAAKDYFKRKFANPDATAAGSDKNAAAQPGAAPPAGETPPGAAPEPGSPATAPAGPLEPGNIDLKNRPRVKNPDGSISTVLSKSFNIDGKEVLLPTISPSGVHLSDEGAIALFRATGQHLGKFATPADANAFAQTLHEQQAQMIAGDLSPGMADLKARMTAGAQTSVTAAAGDVLTGAKEAVPQAIGGVLDALTNASNALESLVPLGEITSKGIVPTADFKAAGGTDLIDAATPGPAESVTGGIVRSTSTFLAGFLPALKAVKGISLGSVALQSVEAGALASAVVLDPHEERLSTYLNTVPALAPIIPDYLADNDPAHESDWQGRIKNAAEGAGLGVFAEGLGAMFRYYKAARTAAAETRQATMTPGEVGAVAAKDATRQQAVADLVNPIPEEALAGLGNPAGPMVELRQPTDAQVAQVLTPDAPQAAPAVFINHARINTPDDVHALIQTMADSDAEAIDVARRGVVPNEQTVKESAAQFQNLEDLIGRQPGPMSASEAVAARKVLTASGEQLLGLAAKAGADGATPADLFAFRRAMQVHYAIQSEVIAARTETARALQSWAIPAGSDKMRADQIAELLGQGGGQDTVTMAKMLGTLANNPSGLNQFVQQSLRGKVKDALFEAWINGLLTSPKTHVVNVLSNTLTTFWQIPERFLAAGISNAFMGGEIKMGEAAASAFAMARGVRDGAALVSRGGNDPSVAHLFEAFSKQERPYGTAISSGAFDISSDSPLGFGIDMLGKLIRTPGAALDAEDKFFKAVNYRMELHALAYRQASEEGLEGKQLAQRMTDIAANPPENIKLEAIDRAHINTFTKKLGATGQAFTSLVNKIPGARLVVPFIRTPANILKFTFARTPLAFASSAIRADIAAGGARAAQAHARIGMGSMVMLGFGSLAAEGVLTGAGPMGSPDETRPLRANMLRTGWQPYSVKIGGRWWRYNRLEPIGMLVGMSADIAEVLGHIGDEEATQVVAAGAVAFAQNMASKTWAQGAFDALAAIDPNNPDSDPGKWLQGQAAGTIPFSGFLRNLDQAVDPVLREPRTTQDGPFAQQYLGDLPRPVAEFLNVTINQYRKTIPGLSNDLPPRRDLWGNPISTASGLGWVYDFLSPVGGTAATDDPVDQMMIDNRIKVALPERAIGGVKLTGDEYSAYVQMAGEPAKKYLDKLVNSAGFKRLSDGPEGAKALIVNSIISKFRKSAADQMLVKFPQVRQRWIANKQQQRQQLTIGAQ